MNQHKIIVLGSINTDMVVQTSKFPAPGETILGGKFLMNPGGKGANQAVAAARLGGSVVFAGKTGNDLFGKQAIESLSKEGINTEHVLTDPDPEQASGAGFVLPIKQQPCKSQKWEHKLPSLIYKYYIRRTMKNILVLMGMAVLLFYLSTGKAK